MVLVGGEFKRVLAGGREGNFEWIAGASLAGSSSGRENAI